jgi:multiple sugar transport system substrate-binding protein
VIALLALAGCGGKAPSGGGGGSGEGGELTLWTHNAGNKDELAIVNQIVEDYNASQTTNQVKVQAFPQAAYNDAVTAAATAKKLPCILDIDAPIVPNWAWAGYLAKLDLPQDMVTKQLPGTLGKWKDQLYSIGYYDVALTLFARKGALDAAGMRVATIDQPWTADEFNQGLDKIKASGKYNYALDLATGDATPEWWTYGYSPFLQSFGGDLIDRNTFTTATGVLNGAQSLAWANWFQGLIKNKVTPAKSGADAFADFVNGKSAMVWSGVWNSEAIKKVKDGVAVPPPDMGSGPKIGAGSWQWGISSSCGNAAGALDYIKFSLQPKYLSQFSTKLGLIPATDEAAEQAQGWGSDGEKRYYLDLSKQFALIRPPTPGYPYITTTFAKAAQDIAAGGDARKILDEAATNIDQNLKSNNNYGA